MNKILLYNPSISTLNIGDKVIYESAVSELKPLLKDAYVVEVSTHLPVSRFYTRLLYKYEFNYKFVLGTNLLMGNLLGRFRQWDINLFNASSLGPCILVGVGWWQYNNEPNYVTKKIYQKILSHEAIHSVRDSYTAEQLKKCGFDNVIVTACPTMWKFSKEFVQDIPKSKSLNVCTTLTDYNKDHNTDAKMLSCLSRNYESVYLWIQGIEDLKYYEELRSMISLNNIYLVEPSLMAFDNILSNDDIEYVGTRLHAGIRALQHKRRTIIVAVDNRAIEKKRDFNLPVIERKNIEELSNLINSSFSTDINIPISEIQKWKKAISSDL